MAFFFPRFTKHAGIQYIFPGALLFLCMYSRPYIRFQQQQLGLKISPVPAAARPFNFTKNLQHAVAHNGVSAILHVYYNNHCCYCARQNPGTVGVHVKVAQSPNNSPSQKGTPTAPSA